MWSNVLALGILYQFKKIEFGYLAILVSCVNALFDLWLNLYTSKARNTSSIRSTYTIRWWLRSGSFKLQVCRFDGFCHSVENCICERVADTKTRAQAMKYLTTFSEAVGLGGSWQELKELNFKRWLLRDQ
ncbi:hypothetical protein Tco_0934436 [Tanacetum coccineum]